MKADSFAWQIGIVGITPVSLYLFERLNLLEQSPPIYVAEQDQLRRKTMSGGKFVDSFTDILSSSANVLIFAGRFTEDDVIRALDHGKHVILDRAWTLSSQSLTRLSLKARESDLYATYLCLQRWSTEFLVAAEAMRSGRLGQLRLIRRTSCEKAVPFDESFSGTVKEFGFPWIDQLLLLTDSQPQQVFAEQFVSPGNPIDDGFVATIRFTNRCVAVIEVQARSHLSFRSGWMLDGSLGAYRLDRIYTVANDGELIDEPFPGTDNSQDDFFRRLRSVWQGKASDLPNLAGAARIMKLIEMIEQSAISGEAIQATTCST